MIYSIGHSTLSAGDFLAASAPVSVILDVRSHPTSRWEQFRKESMEVWLPDGGIGYEWWPSLGGWTASHMDQAEAMISHGVDIACYSRGKFPKHRIALGTREPTPADCAQGTLPGMKPSWTNVGLRDYSFFMSTPEFLGGADELIRRGSKEDVAIMCCECQHWRCHRSMVADYLAYKGVDVHHLMPRFRQKDRVKYLAGSVSTPHSRGLGNRLERYDEYVLRTWGERLP